MTGSLTSTLSAVVSSRAMLVVATSAATTFVHWLVSRRRKRTLAQRVADLLCQYIDPHEQEAAPVVRLKGPDQLESIFAKNDCSLQLGGDGTALTDDELYRACSLVLQYSVRSGSPMFFNQLYGRADLNSVLGDWVASAMNANVHTFEVAPVLTLMERHLLAHIAAALGPSFVAEHDGLFVPGGALGNIYAMHLARHRAAPATHEGGMWASAPLVGFVSKEAHYSYLKAARLLGFGSDNLVEVETDAGGAMLPSALREAVARTVGSRRTPFFVGATAGTTVIGAFDPLRELAAVCAETKMWLHVDAAWGGAALFSAAHRGDLDGVELADSFSWSAHKMLGAALQCAVFITRHAHALREANASQAAYLFQKDKMHAALDAGDKTIQCGRKADMLKLWLLFKSLGDDGVARRVEHAYALAAYAVERINASDGAFVLTHKPSCTNVCFWYVPRSMRPLLSAEHLTTEHPLHKVAPPIKAALQREGHSMVGFQSVGGKPNFFRWVFASTDSVSKAHVDAVLHRIAQVGG
uniref:Cysteine sulfinic acid decarboxylase n=1 Tax=Chrysotila carterae TaxID=13221 RepID=A0A7S4C1X7_CHRCT|mmetsp:Transcript_4559/g.9934  ORF Transcript_4559/g.9934 Transcript_4559/m.9934 type:complete len:525 (+) Transcript_4559:385-1959(+)|eukprot:330706-Pleurochrysis_carterae.AAC.2